MTPAELAAACLYFMMLSFLALGGFASVLPEMHRYVVDVHAWMTSMQFAQLYSLAQIAPGPNLMYVPLIGWHIAGWIGAWRHSWRGLRRDAHPAQSDLGARGGCGGGRDRSRLKKGEER